MKLDADFRGGVKFILAVERGKGEGAKAS